MTDETKDDREKGENCRGNCGGDARACDCGGEREKQESATNENAPKTGETFDFNQDYPLPPPTLITLATTFAQQAMVSMGVLPNPITGKSVFMTNQAKHLIDAVELIFEKTEGNRTPEETKVLENVVHELRMLFVAATNEKNRRENEK